ncbi:MAG: 50S ribosomal protein L21 [candidate division Zixibacteria bacterium RBG_16_53_22]|nr:MAG: 50S ribosomal protein L21 [candidate division Zixibacteria bacterium RBG_16_53_22]
MRAIVESGKKQIAVETNARVKVPLINAEVGKEISFDKVLMISEGDSPIIGKPYVNGATVTAEIVSHGRLDKVEVFKFKKRTKYRKMKGHKQDYTEILVKKISH